MSDKASEDAAAKLETEAEKIVSEEMEGFGARSVQRCLDSFHPDNDPTNISGPDGQAMVQAAIQESVEPIVRDAYDAVVGFLSKLAK